ncbi:MAG: hypothetical protein LBQ60_12165 [Bacteroidales bacterium]|nr:hypothetical protein [Bacteroidales bacterium]
MNRKIFFLSLAVICAVFAGCKDSEDELSNPYDELSIAPTTKQLFKQEGETKTIEISSNTKWKIFTLHDWVSLSASSGKGNGSVNITVEPNNSEEIRDAMIYVQTEDGKISPSLKIEQACLDWYIIINREGTVDVIPEGEEISVEVVASGAWTVDIPQTESWLKVKEGSKTDNSVVLTVEPNDSEFRTAELTFDLTGTYKQTAFTLSQDFIPKATVPVQGIIGDDIDIEGVKLDMITRIMFGDKEGTIVSATATRITVTIPTGAVAADEVAVKLYYSDTYFIEKQVKLVMPVPTATVPAQGTIGKDIIIEGTRLGMITKVLFGDKEGTIVSATATLITVTIPADAAAANGVAVKLYYGETVFIDGTIDLVEPVAGEVKIISKREDDTYVWSILDGNVTTAALANGDPNCTWRGDLAFTAANRDFTIALNGNGPTNTGGQYWSPGESTNLGWYVAGSTDAIPYPLYVTMDMGVKAVYTRMHFYSRTRPAGNGYAPMPVDFEIWGSNSPKPLTEIGGKAANLAYWTSWTEAGGLDTWKGDGTWTKIADCKILNSGGNLLKLATDPIPEGDDRYYTSGYEFAIDQADSYRYLRLVVKETYNDGKMMMIAGLNFWGIYAP